MYALVLNVAYPHAAIDVLDGRGVETSAGLAPEVVVFGTRFLLE